MNYRRKISKNYIKNQYVLVYKNQTGVTKLTDKEDNFFTKFTKIDDSHARIIFFNAVYKLKRFYPKFIIYFCIHKELKKIFKKENAPNEIQKLSSFFAKDILMKSIIFYCQSKNIANFTLYQKEKKSYSKIFFNLLKIREKPKQMKISEHKDEDDFFFL